MQEGNTSTLDDSDDQTDDKNRDRGNSYDEERDTKTRNLKYCMHPIFLVN